MKLKIKINWCKILHKWKYNTEQIEVARNHYKQATITIFTRTCQRCQKKQKAHIGYGSYNYTIGKTCHWTNIPISKQEKRELKLKQLGIE